MSAAILRACSKLVAMPNRGPAVPRREQFAERGPVLGQVDGLRAGADDRHPGLLQPIGQAQRGLPAQLHDDADDAGTVRARLLLGVIDLENILEGQRFEVEPIGGVVVGGHRLGIAVDHHRLEPGLTQRRRGVHAAVVELDPLPDAIGTRAENEHLRPLGLWRDLGFGGGIELVTAVVIRRLGLELRRTGVDGLEHRMDAQPLTQCAHADLAGQFRSQRARSGDRTGRDACCGAAARSSKTRRVEHLGAQYHQPRDLLDEPRVDAGDRRHLLDGGTETQRVLDVVEPTVGGGLQALPATPRWPSGSAPSRSRPGRSQ